MKLELVKMDADEDPITLRDTIAMHALQGILACETEFANVDNNKDNSIFYRALVAYQHADKMLDVRRLSREQLKKY